MKKLMKGIIAGVLAAVSCFTLAACGNTLNYTAVNSQLDALNEVKAGTADAAVMDSVMANYYVSNSSYSKLQVLSGDDFKYGDENYAIGLRKDTNTKDYINYALYSLQENGKMETTAQAEGLESVLKTIPEVSKPEAPADGTDFKAILDSGKFKLGYTIFAPIAYAAADSTLIGFDIVLCRELCAFLSTEYGATITPEFVEINWDEKENELNSKEIDCIWNGFTVTEDREKNLDFSAPYMVNQQVIVIRKDDAEKFNTYAALKKAKFVAESGSAGEDTVKGTITDKIFA